MKKHYRVPNGEFVEGRLLVNQFLVRTIVMVKLDKEQTWDSADHYEDWPEFGPAPEPDEDEDEDEGEPKEYDDADYPFFDPYAGCEIFEY